MEQFKREIDIVHQLRFGNTTKESLTGTVVSLILSKSLFKSNTDVCDFILSIFNIELPLYARRSRTLMIAKTCRLSVNLDNQEVKAMSISIYEHIMNNVLPELVDVSNGIVVYTKNSKTKTNKSGNALKNMNIWLKNNNFKK